MIALVLTVLVVFLILVASEWWWRTRRPNDEFSRKFIHITVGSFAAFWPFYLSWNYILLLSLAFVVVIGLSKYLHVFQSIHSVERPTWGEVCFALAVGIIAYITGNPWIYTVALLHMSLADGLAAIVGVHLGKSTRYKVFGHYKSIVGTATFFVVSVGLLVGYSLVTMQLLNPGFVLAVAAMTAAVENLAGYGLDNLFVPLIVAFSLLKFAA